MATAAIVEKLKELKTEWSNFNQQHIFNFIDELNEQQANQLLTSIHQIDNVQIIKANYEDAKESHAKVKLISSDRMQPVPAVMKSNDQNHLEWEQFGYNLLANSKIAVILLAGGQGTRLGSDLPKGQYVLPLLSGKSLFEIQAQKILKLQSIVKEKTGKDCIIPWFIMTSDATQSKTIQFFQSKNYFGLREQDIFFFEQGLMPCLSPEGAILLESKSKIALSPNGNGGIYKALLQSGAIEEMQKRGVEQLFVNSVDNILVKIADPVFCGCFALGNYDAAAKVIPKSHPEEQVGVVCLLDGKSHVVEYSEIDKEIAKMIDPQTNQLIYNQANICIHMFSLEFIRRAAISKLPFHIAAKKVPCISPEGIQLTGTSAPIAWKLEMFIFDVFPLCEKLLVFEVLRTDEFSALKNASGACSPLTCCQDVSSLHSKWLIESGANLLYQQNKSKEEQLCEISPLLSYAGEGLENLVKGKTLNLPLHLEIDNLN
eukprot:TRINITY_DN890_c0_g1_i1.p1 TRINITY_DN890_c0_g1~~TRINITY_DN890_c0_g1_i1.p1  ORF type:complete len:486 (-),score=220.34 TRINITY_DN890_c0_g1_i1:110-1567(-)